MTEPTERVGSHRTRVAAAWRCGGFPAPHLGGRSRASTPIEIDGRYARHHRTPAPGDPHHRTLSKHSRQPAGRHSAPAPELAHRPPAPARTARTGSPPARRTRSAPLAARTDPAWAIAQSRNGQGRSKRRSSGCSKRFRRATSQARDRARSAGAHSRGRAFHAPRSAATVSRAGHPEEIFMIPSEPLDDRSFDSAARSRGHRQRPRAGTRRARPRTSTGSVCLASTALRSLPACSIAEHGGTFALCPVCDAPETSMEYVTNTNVLRTEVRCPDGRFDIFDYAPRIPMGLVDGRANRDSPADRAPRGRPARPRGLRSAARLRAHAAAARSGRGRPRHRRRPARDALAHERAGGVHREWTSRYALTARSISSSAAAIRRRSTRWPRCSGRWISRLPDGARGSKPARCRRLPTRTSCGPRSASSCTRSRRRARSSPRRRPASRRRSARSARGTTATAGSAMPRSSSKRSGGSSHLAEGEAFVSFLRDVAEAGPLQPVYGIGGERELHRAASRTLVGIRRRPGADWECRLPAASARSDGRDDSLPGNDRLGSARGASKIRRRSCGWSSRLVGEAQLAAGTDDTGLWEYRTMPGRYTFSQALCWVAASRGARLARRFGNHEQADAWDAWSAPFRDELLARAFNAEIGLLHPGARWPATRTRRTCCCRRSV